MNGTIYSCRLVIRSFGGTFVLALLVLAGCGSDNKGPGTSGLKKRVLVSNPLGSAFVDPNDPFRIPHAGNGAVDIMDASKDQFVHTPDPESDLSPALHMDILGAGILATAGGITAVASGVNNRLSLIDNSKEQEARAVGLPEQAEDLAVSFDGKMVYAAVRNAGAFAFVNTDDGSISLTPVPSVHKLVLSPMGKKLLAFIDDPQTLPAPNTNAVFVVDAATKTATPVHVPGMDHPVFGVFDNAETRAFIFNCGAQCSGGTASVMLVDFSGTPTLVASTSVAAATVGIMNGSTLYVAGTPFGSASGTLQIIDVNTMTASAPIKITDGFHSIMRFATNNRLFVGANTCTPASDPSTGLVRGCLTILDVTNGLPQFPQFPSARPDFNVTAIQLIAGRDVVYVCEGGELDIFSTTTGTLTKDQVDVVGKAVDLVQIDP